MKIINEPGEKVYWVRLGSEGEPFGRTERNFLEKLVGGNVGFESAGIPDFSNQDGESLS